MRNFQAIKESVGVGLAGAVGLFTAYFIILTWVGRDWRHPFTQMYPIRYVMAGLFISFGVQIGLYWYLRSIIKMRSANRMAMANSGVSTVTMIACCAHHLTDIAPLIGLSALTIFMARWQNYFLAFAIAANVIGAFIMMRMIKKHALLTRPTI